MWCRKEAELKRPRRVQVSQATDGVTGGGWTGSLWPAQCPVPPSCLCTCHFVSTSANLHCIQQAGPACPAKTDSILAWLQHTQMPILLPCLSISHRVAGTVDCLPILSLSSPIQPRHNRNPHPYPSPFSLSADLSFSFTIIYLPLLAKRRQRPAPNSTELCDIKIIAVAAVFTFFEVEGSEKVPAAN